MMESSHKHDIGRCQRVNEVDLLKALGQEMPRISGVLTRNVTVM